MSDDTIIDSVEERLLLFDGSTFECKLLPLKKEGILILIFYNMTLESELIRRYQGAFTTEDCIGIIKYIGRFEDRNILTYDTEKLTQVDNKSVKHYI